MPPQWYEVVEACLAGLVGSIAGAAAFLSARHGGAKLLYGTSAGAFLFVMGVAGQRSFAAGAQSGGTPGPWDAGVRLPLIGLMVTPVAVGGLLVAAVCLGLALFRDRPPVSRPVDSLGPAGDFEEDDTA